MGAEYEDIPAVPGIPVEIASQKLSSLGRMTFTCLVDEVALGTSVKLRISLVRPTQAHADVVASSQPLLELPAATESF